MATIVLVEDNALNARLTIKVLSTAGHEIVHAETALDGLRYIQTNPPDLVLLDIELPDLDGKTVANRLRRIPSMRTVPVVALSSHSSSQMQRLALAYGCDGFISKPIDIRHFPSQVEMYLAAGADLKAKIMS
jgi:CheY-like chemotaxis protein